jgi:hypothetical protein
MSRLFGLVLLALAVTVPDQATAVQPRRSGQPTRAVFADGRLWVLSETGVLSGIQEGAERYRPRKVFPNQPSIFAFGTGNRQ